ncbi:sodium:proton antiporter [uncultured Secundilactobacillus sp.]|uniref:cation:proton antiporter n=1 Tax=uncultured Secundilactobacillus sp. TaxID=2813935 RepID=UPI002582D748|nr:sodium:proton antiporter [uncultured Secundilactobacillus sp.]
MSVFVMVILLVTAAVAANIVYDLFPRVPLAFYQIAAGLILSLVPSFSDFHLEPELFMLLIIAPLMFNDGQTVNIGSLRRNLRSTLSLAVLLAVVTVVVGGLFAHAIWSAIPLALAFALAAIVTPTDAVAVKSITADLEVPENAMNALESESLFNDASGLVALSLALAAFTTGEFYVGHSLLQFIIVFFGGIILGLILGMLVVLLRQAFQKKAMNAVAVDLPINVMTPFLVYMVAEELGLSGILAVVAAGLVHGMQMRRLQLTSTQTQVVTRSTWTILTSLLNGFVFVLLGTVMPQVWQNLTSSDTSHMPQLIVISIGLYALMTLLRYLWPAFNLVNLRSESTHANRDRLILAISGVHGTITLAMAFSLPLTLSGHPFPFRNSLIFISGTVILLSLIIPTLLLPLLIDKKQSSFSQSELDDAITQMVNFTVDQLKSATDDHAILAPVIETLNSQRGHHQVSDEKQVHQLLEQTGEVESAAIGDMIEKGEVDATVGWKYNRMQIFQLQFAFLSPFARIKMWGRLLTLRLFPKHAQKTFRKHYRQQTKTFSKENQRRFLTGPSGALPARSSENRPLPAVVQEAMAQIPANIRQDPQKWSRDQRRSVRQQLRGSDFMAAKQQLMAQMEDRGFQAVMTYLNQVETAANQTEVEVVRHYYTVRHSRFNRNEATNDKEDQLFIQAFQYEYAFVQRAANDQKLSDALVNELHSKISMDQLVYMQSANS